MNRKLNIVFNMMKPCAERKLRMMAAKDIINCNKMRFFELGEVWIRNYANVPKWMKGIVEKLNGPASYNILVNGNMVHRHVDQMGRYVEDESKVHTVIKKDVLH